MATVPSTANSSAAPSASATNTKARRPARGDLPVDQAITLDGKPALRVRFYGHRQMSASSAQPLVVHFHAGTFVSGDLDSGSVIGHLLAEAGAVVMSVDYPLAPAHPFPAAVEAGHAALEWAWRYRGRLAGAGALIYLAGEEAGGNLAAAIGLKSRDLQRPLLAGQILLSPMLDTCVATASLRSAKAGPVGCRWADGWHDYLQRPDDAMHPYAAPGRAMRLSQLPRTLLVTAEDDPMRDETRAFASRLRDAGVPVDEALLTAVTGWPCSFMDSASRGAAWISPLREQLTRFLATQPEP